jgi:hypothetical protein
MSYTRVGGTIVHSIIGITDLIVSHSIALHDNSKGSDDSVSFAVVKMKTSVIASRRCLSCSFTVKASVASCSSLAAYRN